jgi:hypothetical protein
MKDFDYFKATKIMTLCKKYNYKLYKKELNIFNSNDKYRAFL